MLPASAWLLHPAGSPRSRAENRSHCVPWQGRFPRAQHRRGEFLRARKYRLITAAHVSSCRHLSQANNIDMSSTYDSLQESTCTTLPITKDLSAYWQPQLYYYNPTDTSYTAIPSYAKIYYLQRLGPKGGKLTAFPPGFRMVAGNPMRSSFNASNKVDRAINFVCQG